MAPGPRITTRPSAEAKNASPAGSHHFSSGSGFEFRRKQLAGAHGTCVRTFGIGTQRGELYIFRLMC